MERLEHLPFKQLYEKEAQRLQDANCVRSARMETMGLLLYMNPDVGSTAASSDQNASDGWSPEFEVTE